jgi:hypothetical protein
MQLFDLCCFTVKSQSQIHFTTNSQSVCFGAEPNLWTFDQILLVVLHTNDIVYIAQHSDKVTFGVVLVKSCMLGHVKDHCWLPRYPGFVFRLFQW